MVAASRAGGDNAAASAADCSPAAAAPTLAPELPTLPAEVAEEVRNSHRHKIPDTPLLFNACVARPVSKLLTLPHLATQASGVARPV